MREQIYAIQLIHEYLLYHIDCEVTYPTLFDWRPRIGVDAVFKEDVEPIKRLFDEIGFDCVDDETKLLTFRLREQEKINENMEVIVGQDHTYWIYDNKTDKYYPTSMSPKFLSETEFIEEFNSIGFTLYGNHWINVDFDV